MLHLQLNTQSLYEKLNTVTQLLKILVEPHNPLYTITLQDRPRDGPSRLLS